MDNPPHFSDMFHVDENLRNSKLWTLKSIFHQAQQIRPAGYHSGRIAPFFQPEDSLLDTFCIRMFKSRQFIEHDEFTFFSFKAW